MLNWYDLYILIWIYPGVYIETISVYVTIEVQFDFLNQVYILNHLIGNIRIVLSHYNEKGIHPSNYTIGVSWITKVINS